MKIEVVHEEILQILLNYRKTHSNFTFQLRQKPPKRLLEGKWFTGNDDYIFVGFYKVGCKDNKTKTIGFVWLRDLQRLEVVYKNIADITKNEEDFYLEVIEFLKKLPFKQIEQKDERKVWFYFQNNDLETNLLFILEKIKPKIDELLRKYNLWERYVSSNEEFIKMLNKIENYKNSQNSQQVREEVVQVKTKNIILYGPPGVGKTHNYQRLITMIEEGRDEKTIFDTVTNNQSSEKIVLNQERYQKIHKEERIEFITFHQSYSYEDFIEGFRPTEDGNIKLEDGIFKRVVKKAFDNQEKNYYIIIDEINRGNISKIFGELITLLEEDKRDSYEVTLPYSKEKFVIPSNLYIIATMNSTDKSIATIDIALRRRFTFLKMQPNSNLVQNEEAKALMNSLNAFIQERLGSDFLLGHSYFMGEDVDLEFIKEYKIRPLLEEYFYADETLDIDKLLNGENNAP